LKDANPPNDVSPQHPAGIILNLLVALERLLRRQIIWPGEQIGVDEVKLGVRKWIDRIRLRVGVSDNLVVELEGSQANAVGPVAFTDVNANRMGRGKVAIGVIGKAGCGRRRRIIPVVSELIKNADVLRGLPVEPSTGLRTLEGRVDASRQELKGSAGNDGIGAVLLEPFGVDKEKELVLDDCAADPAAELVALKLRIDRARKIREPNAVIAEQVEGLTMKLVRAGTSSQVNGARAGDLGRDIERRAADAEFLDGTQCDVLRGSAYRLVANVKAVHFDAGGTAEVSVDRNGVIADFRGIEVSSVLHLDAGFQLGEVKEAASIHRHVVDLLATEYALHRRLFRVDGDGSGLHFNRGGFLANFQLYVARGRHGDLDRDRELLRLEALGLHANLVISDRKPARVVGTGRGCLDCDDLPSGERLDRDDRSRHDGVALISDRPLNAALADGGLGDRKRRRRDQQCSEYGH